MSEENSICCNLSSYVDSNRRIAIPEGIEFLHESTEADLEDCGDELTLYLPESFVGLESDKRSHKGAHATSLAVRKKIRVNFAKFISQSFRKHITSIEVHPNNPYYASANGDLFSKDLSMFLCTFKRLLAKNSTIVLTSATQSIASLNKDFLEDHDVLVEIEDTSLDSSIEVLKMLKAFGHIHYLTIVGKNVQSVDYEWLEKFLKFKIKIYQFILVLPKMDTAQLLEHAQIPACYGFIRQHELYTDPDQISMYIDTIENADVYLCNKFDLERIICCPIKPQIARVMSSLPYIPRKADSYMSAWRLTANAILHGSCDDLKHTLQDYGHLLGDLQETEMESKAKRPFPYTLLCLAARYSGLEKVKILVDYGFSMNSPNIENVLSTESFQFLDFFAGLVRWRSACLSMLGKAKQGLAELSSFIAVGEKSEVRCMPLISEQERNEVLSYLIEKGIITAPMLSAFLFHCLARYNLADTVKFLRAKGAKLTDYVAFFDDEDPEIAVCDEVKSLLGMFARRADEFAQFVRICHEDDVLVKLSSYRLLDVIRNDQDYLERILPYIKVSSCAKRWIFDEALDTNSLRLLNILLESGVICTLGTIDNYIKCAESKGNPKFVDALIAYKAKHAKLQFNTRKQAPKTKAQELTFEPESFSILFTPALELKVITEPKSDPDAKNNPKTNALASADPASNPIAIIDP